LHECVVLIDGYKTESEKDSEKSRTADANDYDKPCG
jgi:hypothetical protein